MKQLNLFDITILIFLFFIIFFIIFFISEYSIINLTSIIIALVAILITLNIALKSRKQVDNIANSLFIEFTSNFEDRRLNMLDKPKFFSIYIWKSRVDSEKIIQLLENNEIKPENQLKFLKRLKSLVDVINLTNQNNSSYLKKNKTLNTPFLTIEDIKHLIFLYNNFLTDENPFSFDKKTESDSIKSGIINSLSEIFELKTEQITIPNIRTISINIYNLEKKYAKKQHSINNHSYLAYKNQIVNNIS